MWDGSPDFHHDTMRIDKNVSLLVKIAKYDSHNLEPQTHIFTHILTTYEA